MFKLDFVSRIKELFASLLLTLFLIAVLCFNLTPALALVTDPNKLIPERTCYDGQQVCYTRVTLNYNDPRIQNGVWYATIPKNAYVLVVDAYVSTAFNAGTTNVITLGATSAANEIVASGITAGTPGIYHLTSAAGLGTAVTGNTAYQTQVNGGVPVFIKYAQSGTAATAGVVTIVLTFVKNNDQ